MVDVSRAVAKAPKYGPDKSKEATPEYGKNAPGWFASLLGKNTIKARTGALAKHRKHKFDAGEGADYLWVIYQDILVRHPNGLMGLQDWANRYSLGTIPPELFSFLQANEKHIPFVWNAKELGERLKLLFDERKLIKFYCASPIDRTKEQMIAIQAYEARQKDRERKERKRRASGSISEIERRANARKKAQSRAENDISRTTEWRRSKRANNNTN